MENQAIFSQELPFKACMLETIILLEMEKMTALPEYPSRNLVLTSRWWNSITALASIIQIAHQNMCRHQRVQLEALWLESWWCSFWFVLSLLADSTAVDGNFQTVSRNLAGTRMDAAGSVTGEIKIKKLKSKTDLPSMKNNHLKLKWWQPLRLFNNHQLWCKALQSWSNNHLKWYLLIWTAMVWLMAMFNNNNLQLWFKDNHRWYNNSQLSTNKMLFNSNEKEWT